MPPTGRQRSVCQMRRASQWRVILRRGSTEAVKVRSVVCRVWPPRVGAFCSTVTVANWSRSAGSSMIDSGVDFGLRVVMVPHCSFRCDRASSVLVVARWVRGRSEVGVIMRNRVSDFRDSVLDPELSGVRGRDAGLTRALRKHSGLVIYVRHATFHPLREACTSCRGRAGTLCQPSGRAAGQGLQTDGRVGSFGSVQRGPR